MVAFKQTRAEDAQAAAPSEEVLAHRRRRPLPGNRRAEHVQELRSNCSIFCFRKTNETFSAPGCSSVSSSDFHFRLLPAGRRRDPNDRSPRPTRSARPAESRRSASIFSSPSPKHVSPPSTNCAPIRRWPRGADSRIHDLLEDFQALVDEPKLTWMTIVRKKPDLIKPLTEQVEAESD